MTATTDAMLGNVLQHRTVFAQVRTVDGARWLARGAQQFTGVVLLMAVVGLWLQPGAAFDQELMLVKLALSAFAGMAGAALIRGGRVQRGVEIEIDLNDEELRLVRPQASGHGAPDVVHRCSFAALGSVDMTPHMARMWDAQGGLLAEVPLADPQTRAALLRALRAHGKI